MRRSGDSVDPDEAPGTCQDARSNEAATDCAIAPVRDSEMITMETSSGPANPAATLGAFQGDEVALGSVDSEEAASALQDTRDDEVAMGIRDTVQRFARGYCRVGHISYADGSARSKAPHLADLAWG